MEEVNQAFINELQNQATEEKSRRIQSESNQVATMFQSESNENLIKFQLDIKEEMERIEHLIRKHVPHLDEKGNLTYRQPTIKVLTAILRDKNNILYYQEAGDGRIIKIRDTKNKQNLFVYGESASSGQQLLQLKQQTDNLIFIKYKEVEIKDALFNEHGVKEILNLLAWYMNKNIILSDFDEYEINVRVWQFGKELADFIYNNYEEFGLDTPEKIKHYPMVVLNIVNTIEASYHRALYGKERDSLRQARIVSQSENLSQQPLYPQKQSNKFSLLKPSTW
jgi:hypothetical protein